MTFEQFSIPLSAVILLGVVLILLLLLFVTLLYLYKIACFANCRIPSLLHLSDSKLSADSESDDSDDDIYLNYGQIEKAAALDHSQREKSTHDKSSTYLDEWEKKTLGVSRTGSRASIQRSNKVAIVRVQMSFDTITSKLKIKIFQTFDMSSKTADKETKTAGLLADVSIINFYQVHCALLPDKKFRFKSKSREGPDPVFNEVFEVPKFSLDNAATHSVRFRLYTSHKLSKLVMSGQCLVELSSIDLTTEAEYNFTLLETTDNESVSDDVLSVTESELDSLQSCGVAIQSSITGVPELLLGLSHNSNTGRMSVEIIRGCNFSKGKNKDYYVKVSLFSSTGRELSHTKTSLRKNSNSPVFRESFMFQVALFQLNEVTLMVTVFEKKSIHRKEIVGWIALGYKSSGDEESFHWNELKESTDSIQIVRCHKLHHDANAKKFIDD